MKNMQIVKGLMGVVVLFAVGASPAESLAVPCSAINVRDFGAKGDGKMDDTAAIEAAVRALASQYRFYGADVGRHGAAAPEVIFPEGTYLISRTIAFPGAYLLKSSPSSDMRNGWRQTGYHFLRGIGKAIIRQTDPNADVFYIHCAYRVFIDNLSFEGGKRSLKLFTGNIDAAGITIQNCTFVDSGDFAIECIQKQTWDPSYSVPSGAIDPFTMKIMLQTGSRYELNWDGSIKGYVDNVSIPYYYNSTLMHINRCIFTNCRRLIHSNADGCAIENCRMETSAVMQGPAIRNGGIMKLLDVRYEAHVMPGRGQCFIENFEDNYSGSLMLRNVTVTAGGGRGICPIYNRQKYHSGWSTPKTVILEDSMFAAAGTPENCLVYCPEVPNIVSIRNCRVSGTQAVPALGFPSIPQADYFKWTNVGLDSAATGLAYTVDTGNVNITGTLPNSMKPFTRKPLSNDMDMAIRNWLRTNKEEFLSDVIMDKPGQVVIDGGDPKFGLNGDGTTDDTQAVRRIVAAAGGRPAEIRIPAGKYLLTGTVLLPDDISIRGGGRAYFFMKDKTTPCFRVANARRVAVYNCAVEKTTTAFDIAAASPGAMVFFKNCIFSGIGGTAIQCVGGSLHTDQSQLIRLRVTDSVFLACRQVLRSNACTVVDSIWITPKRPLDHDLDKGSGYIENYGTLRIENSLCVPQGFGKFSGDHRWITNYGRLIADSNRFGAETGGTCVVENRRVAGISRNTVVLQNNWLYHFSSLAPSGLIYCRDNPDQLVLRTNAGMENPFFNTDQPVTVLQHNLSGGSTSSNFSASMSGNSVPENVQTFVLFDPVEGQALDAVPAGWKVTGPGTVKVATGSVKTPVGRAGKAPNAQVATVTQKPGDGPTTVTVKFTKPVTVNDVPEGMTVTVSFKFRINASPADDRALHVDVEDSAGKSAADLFIGRVATDGSWFKSGKETLSAKQVPFAFDHWYEVRISIDLKHRLYSTWIMDLNRAYRAQCRNAAPQLFLSENVSQIDRLRFVFTGPTDVSFNDLRVEVVPLI